MQTYSQLMDFVAMGLGGHAAEQLYLGEFTTGATSDLKKATEVCRRMVTQFGMSEKLGPVYLDGDQEVFVGMEFGRAAGTAKKWRRASTRKSSACWRNATRRRWTP